MKKNIFLYLLIIFQFLIFEISFSANDEDIYKKIDLFSEVLDKINKEYVEEVDQSKSMDAAINGVLQSLDPYSAYMTPEMFKEMKTETSGEFGGLGIEVGMEAGVVKVISPIDNTYIGEVANRFKYNDGKGEIGIISSISQPFCQNCTRGRLSTDGKFITCLFASEGIDLKSSLRSGASDEDLTEIIKSTWASRIDKYSQDRLISPKKNKKKVEMYYIGG